MDCRCKKAQSKSIVLAFLREELLYDIGEYAFVEGDVMPVKDEHERHQVIDVTQDGNVNLVTRILNLAHTEVVELLYPYTKEEIKDGERLDDVPEEQDEYIIEMTVPETVSRKSLLHLRNLIHDYMVARVLHEWMGITNVINPHSKLNWEEKIESIREKIRRALKWRVKPIRLSMHPF